MPQNRTALITGANKGIGFATADALGRAGYRVYLGARDETRGRDAARQLTDNGLVLVDGRWVGLDVTDQASVEAAALTIADIEGSLDALVCNAGISIRGPEHRPRPRSPTSCRPSMSTCSAPSASSARSSTWSKARPPAGSSSSAPTWPPCSISPTTTTRSAPFRCCWPDNSSKTALNAVALHYAKQLAATSILVNVVSPGYVATDLNDHEGFLTPEQAAPVLVHAATLPADGPTGSFIAATRDGSYTTIPW
jgi:NAD(P)-dependent dehydrogenase (short-subunit alcohol dehydrogenase family)